MSAARPVTGVRPPSLLAGFNWDAVVADLDRQGHALTSAPLLDPDECRRLREAFHDDELFRATVDMARYRFGVGTYRYYTDQLPPIVENLRRTAYPALAVLANNWAERLGELYRYPAELEPFLDHCHAAGQAKPTPLILRYDQGGYNALHQDIYGEVVFPFQLTVALTEPGPDFTGGENLFVEQRPRAQSRGTAVSVPLGHAIVFPTRHRPVTGARGTYRATVRHGVSTVTSGRRFSLGVIFHDAA
jgi:hypothetical protein